MPVEIMFFFQNQQNTGGLFYLPPSQFGMCVQPKPRYSYYIVFSVIAVTNCMFVCAPQQSHDSLPQLVVETVRHIWGIQFVDWECIQWRICFSLIFLVVYQGEMASIASAEIMSHPNMWQMMGWEGHLVHLTVIFFSRLCNEGEMGKKPVLFH